MRRGFRLTKVARRALPILWLAVWAAPSSAQTVVCHPIRRGESAGQAARRVTGDSRKAYSASFQIMNGSSRFVPKSQYDRVHAGWRACIVRPPAPNPAPSREPLDPPAAVEVARHAISADGGEPADPPDAPQTAVAPVGLAPPIIVATIDPPVRARVRAESPVSVGRGFHPSVDLTFVWLGTAIAVPWLGLQVLDAFVTRRKSAAILAQHFAHRFVAEFERPLVYDDDTERPLKTRVRRARRGRFDILLAPGPGRRYPNLSDHKRNVEYDVDRVLHALDDSAFVKGALYAQDEWVVVPFQPAVAPK